MATDLENLTTARSNLYAALALHGHKRNYTIDGQTFDNEGLWRRIMELNAAIAAVQGPVEIVDQGVT